MAVVSVSIHIPSLYVMLLVKHWYVMVNGLKTKNPYHEIFSKNHSISKLSILFYNPRGVRKGKFVGRK